MGLRLLGKFWEWYVGLNNIGGVGDLESEENSEEESSEESKEESEESSEELSEEESQEGNQEEKDKTPETVPYSRLKEQSDQLKEVRKQAEAAEKRADELERRIADNEQKSKRKTKEEIDDWYQTDPVAAATALAEDKAYAIIDAQEYKTDVIEELAEGNKDFVPFEKEVKRKLRRIDFRSDEQLRNRVELEFQAALGRKSRQDIIKAEERGKNKALKDKKVVSSNTNVTPSKGSDNVQVSSEAKTFASGMGVSDKNLKDAAGRKDNVVE